MPKEVFGREYEFLAREQLLSFEEIERVAGAFVRAGARKLRITGGEPLLRKGIEDLVGRLARIEGVDDLTLTTNGSLLARKARALKDAGLKRVTVSLDSMDDTVFMAMNDVGFPVQSVLDGIAAAAEAGLDPIKINMVVKRGVNENSVVDVARHFRGTGQVVRFIEYMDVGATNGWRLDDVVPGREIVDLINAELSTRGRRPRLSGRGGPAVSVQRWRRRGRGDHLGHPALLLGLHPRPAVGRGSALHLSLRNRRHRSAAASCGPTPPMTNWTLSSPGCGARRSDRYSEIRTSRRSRSVAKWR